MTKLKSAPRVAAIIGPYMSGKTTLLESLLYTSGAILRKGSVKEGNTVGDSSPEAKARQMSVEVTVASATYLDELWTFIDCPGSVEFTQETLNALMVVDAAIIVVEPDPSRAPMIMFLLKFLEDNNIPHTIFINKIDAITDVNKIRETIDVLQSISQRPLVLREYPIHFMDAIAGYEDLSLERTYNENVCQNINLSEMPLDVKSDIIAARQQMLETISNLDDDFMEKLLDEQIPSRDEVFATLTKGFRTDQIVPIMLGSADKDVGILRLLKQLRHEVPDSSTTTAARFGLLPNDNKSNHIAQVWKTVNAQHIGKQSLIRLWCGEIIEGMMLNGMRISSIMRPFGSKFNKINKASSGEIIALGRLESIKTGDMLTIGSFNDESYQIYWPDSMQPMTACALKTSKMGDDVKLSGILTKLLEEDSSYSLYQNPETKERVLWGQGEIHLKVAVDKIRRLSGVDAILSNPTVPYRETIKTSIKQHGRYKHQSGGHGAFGDVYIEIKPRQRGDGLKFSDTIVGGAIPKNFIPAVEDGFMEFCRQGPLGFPVVDVEGILYFGSFHTVDSSDMAFKAAARIAMTEGMPLCNPVLLEPILEVHISVPFEHTAKAQKIIVSHRAGQILGFDAKPNWAGWDVVDAYIPQSEIQGLIVELRSQTQGLGFFTWSFHHLQELEGRDAAKVIEARKQALSNK